MSEHTPGPWHVELGALIYSPVQKVADAGYAPTERERTHNAYIIAAAPDLLAALVLAVEAIERAQHRGPTDGLEQQAVRVARAAIAKARGGK